MAGVYSDRRAARSRSRVLPPSREENVRLLLGSPYLAIHLLEERVALLVALLVIANLLQLLHGKVVQASRDLLHVHLVVAGYRENGRLRRPLGSLGRSVQGASRGVGHGAGRRSQQACRAPPTRHRSLLDAPHDLLGTRSVAGEGVVKELRVGPDRLPRELLPGFPLPSRMLGELLDTGAACLSLLPEVGSHELREFLGEAPLALPRLCGLSVDKPV